MRKAHKAIELIAWTAFVVGFFIALAGFSKEASPDKAADLRLFGAVICAWGFAVAGCVRIINWWNAD